MKTIKIDGATRFYETSGCGPTVILIHGSLSSSRQWRALIDHLRDRYLIIALELVAEDDRESSGRGAGFSFAQDCALLESLIATSNGDIHIVGHSYGGVVAARAALDTSTRLSSLVLIEPSAFHLLRQAGRSAAYDEIKCVCDRQQHAYALGELELSAGGFIDYWMGTGAWLAMPDRRRADATAALPKLVHDWNGVLDDTTRLEEYRSFATPTLLMHAKDTRRPSAQIVDLLAARLPNPAIAEISSGGHMSPLTNPVPVNRAIAQFVGR